MQTSFLPVTPVLCNRTKPPPSCADADFIAVCDASTERYLCKSQAKQLRLPATEWVCSSLARDCGLPVPPFTVVEMSSNRGVFLFGSQWLGGAMDMLAGLGEVSNPHVFSQIFGLDQFAHNEDRHLNNYLFLSIAGDTVVRPIDFSRAFIHWGLPLPALPMAANCNTLSKAVQWRSVHGYTKPSPLLDSIAALPNDWMANTLSMMPAQWLAPNEQAVLIQWWATTHRQSRVLEAQLHL
jgi:hypothetical protein